jgi:hypothetical protein
MPAMTGSRTVLGLGRTGPGRSTRTVLRRSTTCPMRKAAAALIAGDTSPPSIVDAVAKGIFKQGRQLVPGTQYRRPARRRTPGTHAHCRAASPGPP